MKFADPFCWVFFQVLRWCQSPFSDDFGAGSGRLLGDVDHGSILSWNIRVSTSSSCLGILPWGTENTGPQLVGILVSLCLAAVLVWDGSDVWSTHGCERGYKIMIRRSLCGRCLQFCSFVSNLVEFSIQKDVAVKWTRHEIRCWMSF